MDDENGRKPSRVAFMFLIAGYILVLVGFLTFFSLLFSAMATGGSGSTRYEIYIISALYFGSTSIVGSQVWYLMLRVTRGRGSVKSSVRVSKEPVLLSASLFVVLGYIPVFYDLMYETYEENLIGFFISISFLLLFGVPLYIGCFYLFVIRPQDDESAEAHSE